VKLSTDKKVNWPSGTQGQSQRKSGGGEISLSPTSDVRWAIDATELEVRFGPTVALRDTTVKVAPGTIHALVGENGAGKSTFLGVIAGRIVPNSGSVHIFGVPHEFGRPRNAKRLGVAAIYQELTIIPALSAQANVFLGQEKAKCGLLYEVSMRDRFRELCEQLGVDFAPDAAAGRLSVADQQMLEIMRGIQSNARLLLFDEPTASLALPEREALFRLMRQLRESGVTMMFVSHNLDEVLEIADSVTVFRDGGVAAAKPRSQWQKSSLVRAMIGHEISEQLPTPKPRRPRGAAPLLAARNISLPGAVTGVDLELFAGEIVGIGGLVGSGRTSLLRALAGLEPMSHGELNLNGEAAEWPRTPREGLRLGIAMVPEDRKTQGLVLGMSSIDNIALTDYARVSKAGILSTDAMIAAASRVAKEFGFDERRIASPMRHLSGGNQQKILLGKWRIRSPAVLLVDEPTRGIDVGAKEEIMATLRRLAEGGLGLIVVSSELEEVVAISHRVIVLSEGRMVATLDADDKPVSVQDILTAAFKLSKESAHGLG
jgi:ABC-type sugar transport system ATPase subunit